MKPATLKLTDEVIEVLIEACEYETRHWARIAEVFTLSEQDQRKRTVLAETHRMLMSVRTIRGLTAKALEKKDG